ncbi:CopC domain-containing protein YobA [Erwiniaceae bacterium BAC15a-03b]|uniref:Copper resistance protein C n=1 Tax=Winslowiella arboricola TaxID=2978220 RepID=A0A9J6PPC3_9GAMM|nr:CopC domain-containing protein YobA [Winslowiella arboricola]MCU5775875.1 CopC domain-containing protein YobA [Winslowiella arboricola]MCU5779274.1 CopC domain-containing protein YobA [Winslowiella arboricola]
MFDPKFPPIFSTAVLLSVLAFSPSVLAHAHLKNQYPAANAHVDASPQALTLTFSEDIEPAFSGLEIAGANNQPLPLAKAQRNGAQKNQLIVPLEKPLPGGTYQVKWHVLSVDGHKTKGNYRFSVK